MIIAGRPIGLSHPPLTLVEIGINHNGDPDRALDMIESAANAGAEVLKWQCHIPNEEMNEAEARKLVPPNGNGKSIWEIISHCSFSEEQELMLKRATEAAGMVYLSTPFSFAAADRLMRLGVKAFKVGSGECGNVRFMSRIASYGLPVIFSTGMSNMTMVHRSARILNAAQVPYAIMHATSVYPSTYESVRLPVIATLQREFPYGSQGEPVPIGLSDHSAGPWTCIAAVGLGASVLEKHFCLSHDDEGPDVSASVDPHELRYLLKGTRAAWEAMGRGVGDAEKHILKDESVTREWYDKSRKHAA